MWSAQSSMRPVGPPWAEPEPVLHRRGLRPLLAVRQLAPVSFQATRLAKTRWLIAGAFFVRPLQRGVRSLRPVDQLLRLLHQRGEERLRLGALVVAAAHRGVGVGLSVFSAASKLSWLFLVSAFRLPLRGGVG